MQAGYQWLKRHMATSTKLCLKRWMISITFDALNVDEAEIQRHVFWLYWWFKSRQKSPLALHSACGLSVLLSGVERWDISVISTSTCSANFNQIYRKSAEKNSIHYHMQILEVKRWLTKTGLLCCGTLNQRIVQLINIRFLQHY